MPGGDLAKKRDTQRRIAVSKFKLGVLIHQPKFLLCLTDTEANKIQNGSQICQKCSHMAVKEKSKVHLASRFCIGHHKFGRDIREELARGSGESCC